MPREMPSSGCIPGSTYIGIIPQRISAFIADLWTLRGRIIESPRLQTLNIIACTAAVVPPMIRKASSAPKASAARASASFMTEVGWLRLSRGFIELTSTERHCLPRNPVSSGVPRPCLCPGTSKGTTRLFLYSDIASSSGAALWSSL